MTCLSSQWLKSHVENTRLPVNWYREVDAALRPVSGSAPCGRKETGVTEEELDAAADVIAAVDAGVLQSLNQRIKQRNKYIGLNVD